MRQRAGGVRPLTVVVDRDHRCRRAEALEREAQRDLRRRAEGVIVTAPEALECATCGGEAHATTWGRARGVAYRCTECHAGGQLVVDDRDRVHRNGGVFNRLENAATRRVEADGGGAR